ncbi:covalently-linked cell wall protein [Metarhizium album ARSEF 1941]|uniref:Covalently-linked cell wall protein n=1 Tax=Metarhizium album (strain ARSEF 1941) TaxID=1081103 RepID=A0A0B2WSK0_METAS|nr:covalently-linked cell wall protein [Metarhizium album ARSEF 1941]KHN95930.1 covalently-linked cell wall protein [Metarhizium album ARSEF 1941]
MKWTSAVSLGLAATAMAADEPAGCSTSRDGKFQVSIYSLGEAKRSIEKRACEGEGTLVMTLKDGVLKDSHDRTGYIASNYQFQFDAPPQENAIKSAGFSVCKNGSLALDGSTVFYRCLSGDFYNLYDRHWAAQCSPIEIVATSCNGGNGGGSDGGNGNKPVGTSMVQTTIVTALSDGQPQVHTTAVPIPMCQIGDGQVQVRTTPCASVPPQAPTSLAAPPVSQISDGQIQAPPKTAAPPPPVSQISDGQPQAPTQTQAPPPPVSQISDGQPQAPTSAAPQAPTAVPTAAANRAFPSIVAAVIAVFGAVLYL